MKLKASSFCLIIYLSACCVLWGGNVNATQVCSFDLSLTNSRSSFENTVDQTQFSTPIPIEFVIPTSGEWMLEFVSAIGDSSTGEVVVTIGIQPLKGQQGAGFRLMRVVGEGGEELQSGLCWNHGSISRSLTAGVFTPYALQPICVPSTMQSLEVLQFKLSNIEGYEARGIPIRWEGFSTGASQVEPQPSTDAAILAEVGHGSGRYNVVDSESTPTNIPKEVPVTIEDRVEEEKTTVAEDRDRPKPTDLLSSQPDDDGATALKSEEPRQPQLDDEASDNDHLLPIKPFELIGYYCGGKSGAAGRLLIYLGQDGHMERLYKSKQPYYGYVAIGGDDEGVAVYAPDPLLPMPIVAIYEKGDDIAIECASFGALWNDESGRAVGTDENGNCENGLFRFILTKDAAQITIKDTDYYNDKTHRWVKFVPNNNLGSIDLIGFDMRGFVLDRHDDLVPIDWYSLEKSMIAFDARLRTKGRYYKGLDMKKATSNLRYHNIIR